MRKGLRLGGGKGQGESRWPSGMFGVKGRQGKERYGKRYGRGAGIASDMQIDLATTCRHVGFGPGRISLRLKIPGLELPFGIFIVMDFAVHPADQKEAGIYNAGSHERTRVLSVDPPSSCETTAVCTKHAPTTRYSRNVQSKPNARLVAPMKMHRPSPSHTRHILDRDPFPMVNCTFDVATPRPPRNPLTDAGPARGM